MQTPKAMKFYQEKRRAFYLFEALLVTIIWSSSFVIVKFGLESLGPLTIAGLRYSLGALILLPVMLFKREEIKPIDKSFWIRLAIIGISSYTIGNGALFWGLKFIPATTGSFLMGFIPLLVMIGGAVFLAEIPTRWQVLGVLISLAGSAVFFSGGLNPGEPLGVIIVLVGLAGFMAFSLVGRGIARERSLSTLVLTTLPLVIGGLTTMILALAVEGIPQFTARSLWAVLWLAVVNTALGYLIYNHSLQELTALEMNMVMNLTPIFTAFLSWILLREKLGLMQGIGMVVMIAGVILVQRGRKKTNILKVS